MGNQIIRNMATSIIAEKFNLKVTYANHEAIDVRLGIPLFSGMHTHPTTALLTDENFFDFSSSTQNINPNNNYFQTARITEVLYAYLRLNRVQDRIIERNPFKERYGANNDVFIHVRLSDVMKLNPGIDYYQKALATIQFDKIWISTDSAHHPIIRELFAKFPSANLIQMDEIQTLQFGSTCNHIVLSHGSFSAVIGWLAFNAKTVQYPAYSRAPKMWFGDMFTIPGWREV